MKLNETLILAVLFFLMIHWPEYRAR